MPKIYEGIKESMMKKGKSEKAAKTAAAKIYNSMRKDKPSMPKLSNKHKAK